MSSTVFESIILLSVLASAVVLVLDVEYTDKKVSWVWDVTLVGILVLFVIELIAKVIALGCWGTPEVHGCDGGGGGVVCVCDCDRNRINFSDPMEDAE